MKRASVSSWILRTSLAIAASIMLLSSSPLHAQVDTGSIVGRLQTLPAHCWRRDGHSDQ